MSSGTKKRKYKEYDEHQLQAALQAVQNGHMSRTLASSTFQIPASTLFDKLNEKHMGKQGPPTILTAEQEAEIVEWIEYCAAIGQPKTQRELLKTAAKIAILNGHQANEAEGKFIFFVSNKTMRRKFSGLSSTWYKNFKERNPTITMRKPEALTHAAATVTPMNIDLQFEKLRKYIMDNGYEEILTREDAWYNLDESSSNLNALPSKVVTTKNLKHTFMTELGNHHESYTFTACICADGTFLPPQVIFKKGFTGMEEAAFASGGNFSSFHRFSRA